YTQHPGRDSTSARTVRGHWRAYPPPDDLLRETEYTSRARESFGDDRGNRLRVEPLARRRGARDPGADLEARRAQPRADRDLVLHAERLVSHPRHPRADRQHVPVARRARKPRARLDDRHADDRVLRKRLGPREPQRREERLAAQVVPLEEARVEDDARRVHVAPAHLHRRRVLAHAGKRLAFQENARTHVFQSDTSLVTIFLAHFGP